jgi:hypothetical protein
MLVSAVMSPTFANSYEALLFHLPYTSYTLNIHTKTSTGERMSFEITPLYGPENGVDCLDLPLLFRGVDLRLQ